MSDSQDQEELTEEQKAHIAVLRRKFFRFVSIVSVFGTVILLIVLRFTVYNYKSVDDYAVYIDHKDKFMRFNAAKGLGNFKDDPKATEILMKMLGDEAREVRWHAAASLSKLKDPRAVSSLIQALTKEKDPSAKSIYIYTLGQIKDSRALPALISELNQNQKSNTNEEKVLQFSVVQALATFDNQETQNILKEFEKNQNTSKELKEFSIKMRESKGVPSNQS